MKKEESSIKVKAQVGFQNPAHGVQIKLRAWYMQMTLNINIADFYEAMGPN